MVVDGQRAGPEVMDLWRLGGHHGTRSRTEFPDIGSVVGKTIATAFKIARAVYRWPEMVRCVFGWGEMVGDVCY